MKVVYEDTIMEKLKEAVSTAKKSGKIIKKILLTPEELCRLNAEHDFWFNPFISVKDGKKFMGVPIEEDEHSGPKPKDDYDKMVLAARACGLSDDTISKILISRASWEFIKYCSK